MENLSKIGQLKPEGLFPTIQNLQTFRAERICILIILIFIFNLWIPDSCISRFPAFQVPGFPDFRAAGHCQGRMDGRADEWTGGRTFGRSWLWLAAARGGPLAGSRRGTKSVRSKELGQDGESPISASLVWGTRPSSKHMKRLRLLMI